MVTSANLRELAAIGRALMPHEMIELANQLDELQKTSEARACRLQFMEDILQTSLEAAEGNRSVHHIINILRQEPGEKPQLFSYAEVVRLGQKLDETQKDLEQYKDANRQLAVEGPTRSPEEILQIIEDSNVTRFSFVEVRQLVNHLSKKNPLSGRVERKNIKELMDMVKQDVTRAFTLNEMRMMLRWGREQQQTAANLKVRLARAFFEPKAWVDQATGFFLSDSAKKAMLKAGSINASSFQEGLFSRPDNFTIPENWAIIPKDNTEQFHAGENFHTKSDGTWWCGRMFSNLTAAELQHVLETTLGDLRALYLQHPEGIKK